MPKLYSAREAEEQIGRSNVTITRFAGQIGVVKIAGVYVFTHSDLKK